MKVSLNWLKDYVKFDLSDRDYAELMTGTGTKVETIERLGEDIENVVAGRINSVTPHPDSDHLVICIVDVGGEKPLQIVTRRAERKRGPISSPSASTAPSCPAARSSRPASCAGWSRRVCSARCPSWG